MSRRTNSEECLAQGYARERPRDLQECRGRPQPGALGRWGGPCRGDLEDRGLGLGPAACAPGNRQEALGGVDRGVRGEGKSGQICCRGGCWPPGSISLPPWCLSWQTAPGAMPATWAASEGLFREGPGPNAPKAGITKLQSSHPRGGTGVWGKEYPRGSSGWIRGARAWPVLPPDPRSLKLGW